jgi:hypothetical protein
MPTPGKEIKVAHQLFEDFKRTGIRVREIDAVGATAIDLSLNPCTIHAIRIVSAADALTFMKFWNTSGDNITVGTTAPSGLILPCINAGKYAAIFQTYNPDTSLWEMGLRRVHTVALAVACVEEAGTAGATAPTGNVTLHIAYEEVS